MVTSYEYNIYMVFQMFIFKENMQQIIKDLLGRDKKKKSFYPYFVDKGGGEAADVDKREVGSANVDIL